jgi:hypothetical protein
MSEPWEQLDGESPQAYSAFRQYIDLHPKERSLFAVTEIIWPKRLTEPMRRKRKPHRTIETWSSRYEWVRRAKEYDAYLARVAVMDNTVKMREMADRQAMLAMAIQDKLITYVNEHMNPEELSPNVVARLLDVSSGLELRARDLLITVKEPGTAEDVERLEEMSVVEAAMRIASLFQGARAHRGRLTKDDDDSFDE